MNSKMIIYVLSPLVIVLGLIYLVNTISAPPYDNFVYMRDLITSILAVALGIAALPLIRKFSSD